jgi:hypothetical protein
VALASRAVRFVTERALYMWVVGGADVEDEEFLPAARGTEPEIGGYDLTRGPGMDCDCPPADGDRGRWGLRRRMRFGCHADCPFGRKPGLARCQAGPIIPHRNA